MSSNVAGRKLPAHIEGYGAVKPFTGAFDNLGRVVTSGVSVRSALPGRNKLQPNLRAAIRAAGVKDGAVISFHHHLRNGDHVLNDVVAEIAALGISGIHVAASAFFPVHAPLVEYIRKGVVSGIHAAYIAGPLAQAISRGAVTNPVTMVTHGGRARAIQSGDLHIDVAFVAAPAADVCGNANGVQGPAACGTLGYAMVDAQYADTVVVVTDTLVPYPACPIDITQDRVDYVVQVASIGDPNGIVSGITRATTDPVGLQIADSAAKVIEASGLLGETFSFQTGAGGISLAVADSLKAVMLERGVQGSFASGGITGYLVDMLDTGLFRALFDVQCFDLKAVDSYRRNRKHLSMSASMYANAHNRGAIVNQLDTVILGAAEIDLDFNVNVSTASDGSIIGGSGGHADCAAGAKLAIITTRVKAGENPKVVDRVTTVTTPGETVDVLVTEAGVAVNPRRAELADRLRHAGLPLVSLEQLRDLAGHAPGAHKAPGGDGRLVAVVEYRDGTVIDTIGAVR